MSRNANRNDGRFPDDSPVLVRYPLTPAEMDGDRAAWPWVPGYIVTQCGPDEWEICDPGEEPEDLPRERPRNRVEAHDQAIRELTAWPRRVGVPPAGAQEHHDRSSAGAASCPDCGWPPGRWGGGRPRGHVEDSTRVRGVVLARDLSGHPAFS